MSQPRARSSTAIKACQGGRKRRQRHLDVLKHRCGVDMGQGRGVVSFFFQEREGSVQGGEGASAVASEGRAGHARWAERVPVVTVQMSINPAPLIWRGSSPGLIDPHGFLGTWTPSGALHPFVHGFIAVFSTPCIRRA